MSDGTHCKMAEVYERTQSLIEKLHTSKRDKTIIINPDYLDDEKLPEEERTAVLREIFNRNIREKQMTKLAQHLTPILVYCL
jgi:cell division control protein 6